jgi:predicted dehydrogenase/nucleoside-diphosphate-sugar epimerase
MTKVGMIGAGFILNSHATAVKALPGVTLGMIADASLGRAEAAAARYGFAEAGGSIEAMAASDCEVVHILLPPAFHLDAAEQMVAAGKSVFLEKPMGLDSARCDALCAAAEAKGLRVGVNHNFLFGRTYEDLRARIHGGDIGRIDQVQLNWHYHLAQARYGPFDQWMLAEPGNVVFELLPHLSAFLIDLVGEPVLTSVVATSPITLPGGATVYRHWTISGTAGEAQILLSLSITDGHPERSVYVRGRGGVARLDFARDFGGISKTATDNPIFDAYGMAATTGKALVTQAKIDRRRRLKAALAKRPDANPFEETIFRSISRFYGGELDARHDGRNAAKVIRLCENIVAKAGLPKTTKTKAKAMKPVKPTVLIVGGTGFIGRKLVKKLVGEGVGVRVLTRGARGAAVLFEGLGVDLVEGSHGNPATAKAALEGIDTVYHLAKTEGKRWPDYLDGDIAPTRVLGEAAAAADVKRFIYTGTIDSYASASASAVIDNTTPVDRAITRRNHYARSKAACEALLSAIPGLPLVIMRPAIVIGEGAPPAHPGVANFLSETSVNYWGDGTNLLPLVLVDDVADALARARTADGIEGKSLLITSPPLLTAQDYVAELGKAMGTRIDAHPRPATRNWMADWVKEGAKNAVRHPNRRWPSLHDWACRSHKARYDASATETALGWSPAHDRETMIERGIVDAVRSYLV